MTDPIPTYQEQLDRADLKLRQGGEIPIDGSQPRSVDQQGADLFTETFDATGDLFHAWEMLTRFIREVGKDKLDKALADIEPCQLEPPLSRFPGDDAFDYQPPKSKTVGIREK